MVLVAGGYWVRSLVFDQTLRSSLDTLRVVEGFLPKRAQPRAESKPLPFWPMDEEEENETPENEALVPPSTTARPGPTAKYVPPILPTPANAYADVGRVLDWADQGLMPRGMVRPTYGDLPAGIELFDVASLGVGLLDGDRLIAVDGAPATDRGAVIRTVLEARGRGASSTTAKLARRTSEGVKHFTVTVEQPYPEDVTRHGAKDTAPGTLEPPHPEEDQP